MERSPITVGRKSIVQRTAIFRRVAICSSEVKYETCRLCDKYTDCLGKRYVEAGSDEENKNVYRIIHVTKDFDDWESLEQHIWEHEAEKTYIRLLIDRAIPQEVLWAASYSAYNILQINVDMTHFSEDIEWIRKLIYMSDNCGMYCLLFLYPIVPGLVKTNHVLDIIDSCRNAGDHLTLLKFCEITNCIENEGYLNFNGEPVSIKYLEKTPEGVWVCTEEYLRLFLEKLQIYTTQRKQKVVICGTQECTGLAGEKNAPKS